MKLSITGSWLIGAAVSFAGEVANARFHEGDLTPYLKEGAKPSRVERNGIPFQVVPGGEAVLDLRDAGWPEWKDDPATYNEAYDGIAGIQGRKPDASVPLISIPNRNYTAVYLLASASADLELTNRLTIRIGRRISGSGSKSQSFVRDFVAEIPRSDATGVEGYQWIRVPLPPVLAQDIEGDVLDVELTKEVRLARRQPDPNRFRWRPLGLKSGVKIAALTFEESPLQMNVEARGGVKLFELPGAVAFDVGISNPTKAPINYQLVFTVGSEKIEKTGLLAAGEVTTIPLEAHLSEPGHYRASVDLLSEGSLVNRYESFVGVLPKDERRYREESKLGTWATRDVHFYPSDPDIVGKMYYQLGLRHGMFNYSAEERRKYGVVKGNAFKVNMATKDPEAAGANYTREMENHPDLRTDFLLFHEDAISGGHATRIPDIFHDRPPYQLNPAEKERFDKMWNLASSAARSMRKEHPEVKIYLGNGGLPLREEFYRRGFPAELFDAAGNESGAFSRIPESQPPDVIANNASLWMDRQLLDHYGYKDKSVYQCHEITYPATNPGNLSYQTQADYFVRNILHSLAWQVPAIRVGGIVDPGNSYRFSNWGGAAFFTARPELAPKPSAVAIATLTAILDGAEYEGYHETGSDSLYLMRFRKKNGSAVLPFWTVRGVRPMEVAISGAKEAELVRWDGKKQPLAMEGGKARLLATASPVWLVIPVGAEVTAVTAGEGDHSAGEPTGAVSEVHLLNELKGWRVSSDRNALLEFYNPLTPRRKGNFAFSMTPERSLKVVPMEPEGGKETMPMYAELVHDTGIELSGKPAELGVWVKGNSSWSRLIYELEDASGQRWTSIGARARSGGSPWMADWLGSELAKDYKAGEIADWNTDDAWGLSRINFDGWRYVGVPLPGQYPGEGYRWPANSQWRWDKDGMVHYPLKLRKVIVEMPEKVLYLDRYAAPKHSGLELKRLVTVEKEIDAIKREPEEYVERVQVDIR